MTTPEPDFTNWRVTYAKALAHIYTMAGEGGMDPQTVTVALEVLKELRLGIAANLLPTGVPVKQPAPPTCGRCGHPRRTHGHTRAGCLWESPAGDYVCPCSNTYMDLSPTMPVVARDPSDPMPEQADPVYVPLDVPGPDPHPDGSCGEACASEHDDPRDEPPGY